jgi:UDP-N-acetylglucosamine pyrophosphorylase
MLISSLKVWNTHILLYNKLERKIEQLKEIKHFTSFNTHNVGVNQNTHTNYMYSTLLVMTLYYNSKIINIIDHTTIILINATEAIRKTITQLLDV